MSSVGKRAEPGTGNPGLVLPPAVHRTDMLADRLLQPDDREDAGGTGHRSSPSKGYILSTHKSKLLVSGQSLTPPQVGECGSPPPIPYCLGDTLGQVHQWAIGPWDEGENFFHQAGNLIHCSSGVPGPLSSSTTMIIPWPNVAKNTRLSPKDHNLI